MREVMELNFGWRFSPDFRQEYIRTDFKDNVFRLVDIPHSTAELSRCCTGDRSFARVTCYRRHFILPQEMYGKRLLLTFDGVMGCAAVFINGKPVSVHRGGYTPFTCDITDAVSAYKNAGDNLITVAVDSTEREDTAPGGDMSEPFPGGGIYRSVRLVAVENAYIVNARVNPIREKEGWSLDLAGEVSVKEETEVKMYLLDGENRLFGKFQLAKGGRFACRVQVASKVEEWTLEKPRMYDLLFTTASGDEYNLRFGFRDMSFSADGFRLNGKKLRLVGLERIQNYPAVGAAMPACAQRADVELLRELGCNIVRTGRTPPAPEFLDACDELGLLVFEEIPGRGTVSSNADWRDCLLENVRELVIRDRHHPSIVLWGTRFEEAPDCDELFRQTFRITMELDGLRQTTGVRSISGSRIAPVSDALIEDVYAVNDYTHDGSNAGLERKKNVLKAKLPYLVAGHTNMQAPAKAGETVLLDQALRHAMALDAAFAEPESCGVIGKTLCDYNTRSVYGDSCGMCRSGVADDMRVKKPAAYVYESQQEDHPVMELFSSLYSADRTGAESSAAYCFTNCDRVELYRDDKYVATFLPEKKSYPNLPHPPVVIDDFVGDLPVSEDGVDPKDLPMVKTLLYGMMVDGDTPSESRLKAASAQLKNKLAPAQLSALSNKYIAGRFGGATFRFDGVTGGKVTRSIVSAPATEAGLKISCDRTELHSADTYDCARIEMIVVDQNGRRLYGCTDAVSVECVGSLEVIGPKLFTIEAGACAFYVRTKGGKGTATVKITTGSLGSHSVEFTIIRDNSKEFSIF